MADFPSRLPPTKEDREILRRQFDRIFRWYRAREGANYDLCIVRAFGDYAEFPPEKSHVE
jgi:hypothetical protein